MPRPGSSGRPTSKSWSAGRPPVPVSPTLARKLPLPHGPHASSAEVFPRYLRWGPGVAAAWGRLRAVRGAFCSADRATLLSRQILRRLANAGASSLTCLACACPTLRPRDRRSSGDQVKEATNSDPYGPSGNALSDISDVSPCRPFPLNDGFHPSECSHSWW